MKRQWMTDFMGAKFWWVVVGVVVFLLFVARLSAEGTTDNFTPAPVTQVYHNLHCYQTGFDLICPNQAPIGPTTPVNPSP